MAQKNSDLRKINELIEIMKANDLVEIEIKHGDDKIFLKRRQGQTITDSGQRIADSKEIAESEKLNAKPNTLNTKNLAVIKSPIVGTFYATPSPDSDLFVEVGSHVDMQTVVCIVEAMKVMNEIKAETSGTIAEVLVSNGQAVEYGQELFKVKPE